MFEKEAEEYAEKLCQTCTLDTCRYNILKTCAIKESIKQAFLAGLKAQTEWHDLRKNPNDLPKKVGNYIVCFLDTACERYTFELSFVDYFEDKHWIDEDCHNIEGYDEGVIAWCEIPTFDKE